MKNIYSEMQNKTLPQVHNSVDLSRDVYLTILDIYLKACDKVLAHFSNVKNVNKPNEKINILFEESVSKEAALLKNKHSELTKFKK